MLCIYFSLSVQCMLTLLLQLKQAPTDSSYKPSFKKKDRPGTEKQRYKSLWLFSEIRGATVAVTKSIFFSSGSLRASPQHYNAVFLILVFVFYFFKYFYIIFFCIQFKNSL